MGLQEGGRGCKRWGWVMVVRRSEIEVVVRVGRNGGVDMRR